MKGRVIRYFPDKGFGFISDRSGYEYFFHISNVTNQDAISPGISVEFENSENEKGKLALNIKAKENSKFIKLGDRRIKISNIKEYSKRREVVPANTLPGELWNLGSLIVAGITGDYSSISYIYKLQIKTYQNETITFEGGEEEIDSIIKELDDY